MHPHSIAAYHAELPRLSRRALKIIDWLELHGPATDREVKDGIGFGDMNSVRPRITPISETKFSYFIHLSQTLIPRPP